MNAGLAIHGSFAYIGSRTDSSGEHPHPGVLIVDVSDPARPRVVGEIGPNDRPVIGLSSRELRVWPQGSLLIVMNISCERTLHRCRETNPPSSIDFYDIGGTLGGSPRLISTYRPPLEPHEMYLWVDPMRENRALLYLSTNTPARGRPHLIVVDISSAREGSFRELVKWNGISAPDSQRASASPFQLHSVFLSADGRRGYLAYWAGGFHIVDTSELAEARPDPMIRSVNAPSRGATWRGAQAHSAVKVPGRPLVILTDEVYSPGCPWGWTRTADISEETRPRLAGQFRLVQNHHGWCETIEGRSSRHLNFSSHNPTSTGEVALISWHSAGLQAVDIRNPLHPIGAGAFLPDPLARVSTEDPGVTGGRRGVAMWSFPIVRDGLIHVVDIRNGLYLLRYAGVGGDQLAKVSFLEGNSNLGDAAALVRATPAEPATAPPTTKATEALDPDVTRTDAPRNVSPWRIVVGSAGAAALIGLLVAWGMRRLRR